MTARIASGRGVPATRPNSTSTAMRSSVDVGLKRVRARQVDEIERHTAERSSADATFDGDSGIVGRVLTKPRQPVEDGALAGVRIADHGDGAGRLAAHGNALGTLPAVSRRLPAASAGVAIRHHLESPRLLLTQRDRRTVDPDLERVAPERPAQKYQLGPLDEPEHHQPLDGRIGGLDRFDKGAITGLEIRKCQTSTPCQTRK